MKSRRNRSHISSFAVRRLTASARLVLICFFSYPVLFTPEILDLLFSVSKRFFLKWSGCDVNFLYLKKAKKNKVDRLSLLVATQPSLFVLKDYGCIRKMPLR